MRVAVSFDDSALKARTPREIKRLAFNTALAINKTAEAVQLDQRVNLEAQFTIRQPQGPLLRPTGFVFRLVKISPFASARQGRPFAEIGIDPTKKRGLLPHFEKGGARPAFVGKRVAVPLTGEAARPSFAQPVEKKLRISALRFRSHTTSGGKLQWKGSKRTFMLFPAGGDLKTPGIFQRGGGFRGKKAKKQKTQRRGKRFKGLTEETTVERLYSFEQRPELKPVLGFVALARKTIAREWPKQFAAAYRKPA